ncbi:MAG: RsmE family RNA methyltransferase [bacterium]
MKIYLERSLPAADSFIVDSEYWSHYLTNVRRLRPGDPVEIAGSERVVEAEIKTTEPLRVEVLSSRPKEKASYSLWLIQSLTRKKKFEEAVKIGSELGVTDFLPLISRHTVRRPNKPEKQRDRWRKIALDSTRITDRDWLPKIHLPVDFEELEAKLPALDKIYWGDAAADQPRELFTKEEKNVAFIVGPEGDFSEKEKLHLSSMATGVSLGKRYFRAETASIVFTTLWLYR